MSTNKDSKYQLDSDKLINSLSRQLQTTCKISPDTNSRSQSHMNKLISDISPTIESDVLKTQQEGFTGPSTNVSSNDQNPIAVESKDSTKDAVGVSTTTTTKQMKSRKSRRFRPWRIPTTFHKHPHEHDPFWKHEWRIDYVPKLENQTVSP